jgi:SAM-dependent methyltransferase
MGIRLQSLDPIDAAAAACRSRDSLWAMGSQICSFASGDANAWLRRNGYGETLASDWREDPAPLFHAMGFSEYVDVDVNNLARRNLDLTQPLPDDCKGVADLVLDSGTLEHIFELPTALRNMNRLLKPGGVIVHMTPVTFFDHGFINVNPSLYGSFYKANGYTQLFMTFQITVHNPFRIPRISPWLPVKLARFNLPWRGHGSINWVRFMRRLSAVTRLPRNLMVIGAFRKEDDRSEFETPTDIWVE